MHSVKYYRLLVFIIIGELFLMLTHPSAGHSFFYAREKKLLRTIQDPKIMLERLTSGSSFGFTEDQGIFFLNSYI